MQATAQARADLDRLAAATQEYLAAPIGGASPSGYQRLAEFLATVRKALRMDVAFVSRFAGDQRVFKVVSASSESPAGVVVGASDPLVDSYCSLVVDGRLPQAIPDADAIPQARAMPITQRLRIRAYLSVPVILAHGEVFGTLCCMSHEIRPNLGTVEASALQAVADAIAASIARDEHLRERLW
jgi:GAF domain-containing protein